MPTDVEKLRVLLPHWIKHNAEHAKEFRAWADRASVSGAQIESAAGCLEAANKALREALQQLGGPRGGDQPEMKPTKENGSEIIQIHAEPVPVEPRSRELDPGRAKSQAVRWLGTALAFAGREIVPRLAALLLDAWDRRANRPVSPSSDVWPKEPALSSVANLSRESR